MVKPKAGNPSGEGIGGPSANLEHLKRALSRIDRPGTFCVAGRVPAILPGLEVDGLGPIGLPLTPRAAKELIKHCHQAPYGKGEETLVDTKVRRVWRLETDHFALKNPDWDRVIKEIVGKVQQELGLEGQEMESHLYDLLLYDAGSFFLPHQDGEKLRRMVATLVVVLPSSFEGGELIVRHEGQERTIDFGGPAGDVFHIQYAAFYADCEHEVRPLEKGYRLCLVYNLTLAKSKKSRSAPRDSQHVDSIARLLRNWADEDGSAEKLGIALDHQYTQHGLSWDALKGTDRAKARVLAEAARRAECQAYLALLTLHESGSAEYAGGGWRGRYGYGRRPNEYGEVHGADSSEYEMGEIYETSLTADHWSDPEGNRLPIGEMVIEEDEILDPEAIRRGDPEVDFEGYTGNAGMTLDHWYRHAAIFVWPERRHFQVICDRDSRAVVPELIRMVARWKNASGAEAGALEAQSRELAAAIIKKWPANAFASARPGVEDHWTGGLIEALIALDDVGLIGDFLGGALTRDASARPGGAIAELGRKYGWSAFRPQLASMIKATTPATIERNVALLESIGTSRPRKKDGWTELCATLASGLVSALEAIDRSSAPIDWRYRPIDRVEVLSGLARSLIAAGQSELMSRLIAHILAMPAKYPLTDVQIPAIAGLQPWLVTNVKKRSAALNGWLDAVRVQLEALTAREPAKPTDFRRAAPITCACSLCGELKRFLEDPRESVHRFPVRKELRRHLHSQIDSNKIDLIHVTERRGSPQTLVCTKNTASYEASLKKYHDDRTHLAAIKAIQAKLPK